MTTRRPRSTRATARVVPAIAVLAGLLLLLWGADTLARRGAESLVAQDVQGATGADQRPEVHVRGRFFLPQVLRGAYDEVDVTTVGFTSGPLRVERVDSTLSDVRVPFHDVLVRDIRQIGVGRSEERITMRYDDLNAYLAATDRPVTLTPAPDGLLDATGTVNLLGQHLGVRARVAVDVAGSDLQLTPQSVDTGGSTLSAAARALLGQRLTVTVPLGSLPFGQQLTGVDPGPDAVRVTATGTAIVVRP